MAAEQRDQEFQDQLDVEVRAAMQAYGRGEISTEEAAQRVAPAYAYALSLRNSDELDETAAEPHAFLEVALARQTGVITMDQYVQLAEVLRSAPVAE